MKNCYLLLSFSLFLVTAQINAQVTLPYFSGFDNINQKLGWREYKKAATEHNHWGYGNFHCYSPPFCIGHDYSPGTGLTLTDNWYVSPGFSIHSGGMLDSIRYKLSGWSNLEEGDTIAIYLLNGSPNPSLATSKTLLFDFRGADYLNDNIYRIKTNIPLAAASGLSYLALRYRNTDTNTRWLTVYFDNISISGGTTGIAELNQSNDIELFPNPTESRIKLVSRQGIKSIRILNGLGEVVQNFTNVEDTNSQEIDLTNQKKGIYFVEVQSVEGVKIQKIIRQ